MLFGCCHSRKTHDCDDMFNAPGVFLSLLCVLVQIHLCVYQHLQRRVHIDVLTLILKEALRYTGLNRSLCFRLDAD